MKMVSVESSHINAIGYDEETKTMRVEYSYATYDYKDVPKEVYEQIMNADSKGKAMHEARNSHNFEYKKLED
jgi:hypothetical protein